MRNISLIILLLALLPALASAQNARIRATCADITIISIGTLPDGFQCDRNNNDSACYYPIFHTTPEAEQRLMHAFNSQKYRDADFYLENVFFWTAPPFSDYMLQSGMPPITKFSGGEESMFPTYGKAIDYALGICPNATIEEPPQR